MKASSVVAVGFSVVSMLVNVGPAAAKGDKQKPKQDSHADAWSFQMDLSRGRIGVQVTGMTEELRTFFGAPQDAGVLVSRVSAGTPAAKAGIKVGDVIVEVSAQKIKRAWDVISALGTSRKGDQVQVQVIRDKKSLSLKAVLDSDGGFSGLRQGGGGRGNFDFDMGAPDGLDLDDFHILRGGQGDAHFKEQLDKTRERLEALEERLKKLEHN